ncbi:MAG: PilZ domain-containing protein [Myxococcaceae bacterium]
MDSNSRKYPRAPLTGTVKFYEWNRPLAAEAAEISGSGIFVGTQAPIAEGALITLRLSLPGSSRGFTVLGRVVRTVRGGMLRKAGLGVDFVDITPGDRRQILDYVARRTERAA